MQKDNLKKKEEDVVSTSPKEDMVSTTQDQMEVDGSLVSSEDQIVDETIPEDQAVSRIRQGRTARNIPARRGYGKRDGSGSRCFKEI